MKVLIVNTSDSVGGAARAAYRLHKALIVFGIDSKMIVQSKQSNDSSVFGSQTKFGKGISVIRPTIDQIPVKLYKNKSKSLFLKDLFFLFIIQLDKSCSLFEFNTLQ